MTNPILIDPLAFGRDGQSRSGRRAIADLNERVLENLADNSGEVQFVAEGFMDGSRRSSLRLKVTGTVNVVCQRCLEPMVQALDSEAMLTFFRDEEKLAAAVEINEDLDAVMAEEELDVIALVEDEIIMGLSLSPKHEKCGDEVLEHGKAGKPNPFAVLAALKKPKSE
jgi:uncharacterized protein